MKYLLLLTLSFLLFAPAAKAQGLDPQVAILKGQIEGFLEAQKITAQKNGCLFATNGDLTVEKANGYYAFTLPHITFTDAKGVRSELGMLAINATPDGTDNWKISMALPTPVNSFNPSGKQTFRTDLGAQNISGVWNVKLGHFTNLNGSIATVKISNLVEQTTMTVANASLNALLSETTPGTWSGKANALLANVSVFDAETNFTGTLPKVTLTSNLSGTSGTAPLTKDQITARAQNGFGSLLGAPQNAYAVVTGLDSVNTQLQQAMLTAKPAQRQEYLGAILMVSAVSGIGRPVPNDSASRSYDVVFGTGGKVTVNGTDFSTLTTRK